MLADQIAKMIEEMLEQSGGALELQRNEMAGRLGCVPSQISYVLTSRFTPERGYIVESRRGGGEDKNEIPRAQPGTAKLAEGCHPLHRFKGRRGARRKAQGHLHPRS